MPRRLAAAASGRRFGRMAVRSRIASVTARRATGAPSREHGLVELEPRAPHGRDAGPHQEQIVEPRRRDEIGDTAGDREDQPVHFGQLR